MTNPPETNDVATGAVESADGTRIGYRRMGSGPAIVLVHGSIATGEPYLGFAAQLAEHHSVYVMDRRGRGLSDDAPDYTIGTEAADIIAVLTRAAQETGSVPVLWGHSYGAICTLEAVRLGADVESLVVFEPPLPYDGPVAGDHLGEYAAAISVGDRDRAMRIAARHFLRISAEETEGLASTPLWDAFLDLTPTWSRELAEIDATASVLSEYGDLPVRTLLLIGEISPGHLIASSKSLAAQLPDATVNVLEGQNHFAHVLDPAGLAAAVRSFVG